MVWWFTLLRTRFNSTNSTRTALGSVLILGYRVMNESNISLRYPFLLLTLEQSDRRILPVISYNFPSIFSTLVGPISHFVTDHVVRSRLQHATRRIPVWLIDGSKYVPWITRAYSRIYAFRRWPVCIATSLADRSSYNLAKCCIVHHSCAHHKHTRMNSSFEPVDLGFCFRVCVVIACFFLNLGQFFSQY